MLKAEFINPTPMKDSRIVIWEPLSESWTLERARLRHQDGSPLTSREYMRIQKFMRLWRKIDWTVYETDKAISGLSRVTPSDSMGITPDLLEELVSLSGLHDTTGLEPLKLLTFWSSVSTQGGKSLYSRLFLTPGLIRTDPVFKQNIDSGNYCTNSAKISEHTPVILAALNITKTGLDAIRNTKLKAKDDKLSIENFAILYRHSLMAKILHVALSDPIHVIGDFGYLFESAASSLRFLELWQRMGNAGFSFTQLEFVLNGTDNPLKPLGPSKMRVLTTMKALSDGLEAIDTMVAGTNHRTAVGNDLTAKLSMLYENSLTQQIIEFWGYECLDCRRASRLAPRRPA